LLEIRNTLLLIHLFDSVTNHNTSSWCVCFVLLHDCSISSVVFRYVLSPTCYDSP